MNLDKLKNESCRKRLNLGKIQFDSDSEVFMEMGGSFSVVFSYPR